MASSRGYLRSLPLLCSNSWIRCNSATAAPRPFRQNHYLERLAFNALEILHGRLHNHQRVVNMAPALGAFAPPWNDDPYSPIVRMTLLSGRVLFDDSLSSCESISSYFGTVVTSPFGTMCTTL